MERIIFEKGMQRDFLKKVLFNLSCPSLRALNQFGLDLSYSTLKNYFNESRTIPLELFNNLCYLSKINKESLGFKIISGNWGQSKGGKISKRRFK